ncbi:MFS transporter [Oceaniglobus trochenteri]|uniref:MFS transporter n=1 Tax=Oceaniglobus trochenteri TaxID=2763260 RepID=UPI001CFF8982|nr:MFS transporter [Oceaniglobus trochenteri]
MSGSEAAARPPTTFSPFRHKTYRTLWLSSQASNLGGLIQSVGAAWLMTDLTDSPTMIALVQSSITLPIMVFSLTAGVFADSFNRRRIMLFAQCFMLTVSSILAVLAYFDFLNAWLLLSFTFLIGCGVALHNPSWQASIRDLVPREELHAAVALNSVGFNLMRSIGPAIGGMVVAVGGAAFAFAMNAVSYVSIIIALTVWSPPDEARRLPNESFFAALSTGLRYVSMSHHLLRVILRGGLFGFAAVSILALMPVVARDSLGGSAITYGILLGCFGLGAIGGAFSSGWLRVRLGNERLVELGFGSYALGTLCFALSPNAVLAGISLLGCGCGWVLVQSTLNVSIQRGSPRWILGRALSMHQTTVFGGMAIGAWMWGRVSDEWSTTAALLVATAILVCGIVLGVVSRIVDVDSDELEPAEGFSSARPRMNLMARSGPILISVEYEIDHDSEEQFLAVIKERRRMRMRDGARHWTLARDLENPDLWTESFYFPTWSKYHLYNLRRTSHELLIEQRLATMTRDHGGIRERRQLERPHFWLDGHH